MSFSKFPLKNNFIRIKLLTNSWPQEQGIGITKGIGMASKGRGPARPIRRESGYLEGNSDQTIDS